MCIADAELGGVQDNQDFRDQGLHHRLTGLAANKAGHVIATLAQKLLESAQHSDPLTYRRCLPRRLRLFRAQHGVLDVARTGTRQLGQHLSGCRVRGYDRAVTYDGR